MAEYVLKAELTVGGGFAEDQGDNPREFLMERLREAVAEFPTKGEIRVAVVGTSGNVYFDPEDWLIGP